MNIKLNPGEYPLIAADALDALEGLVVKVTETSGTENSVVVQYARAGAQWGDGILAAHPYHRGETSYSTTVQFPFELIKSVEVF